MLYSANVVTNSRKGDMHTWTVTRGNDDKQLSFIYI